MFLYLIDIKLKKCVTCPDQDKTQDMCDKAVDDSLAAVKLIPNWFVTSKMIKELFTALYAYENILL